MTDELKERFQQLVADPPPPTAVPSEAVFARVRTVRRRRTTGVAVLAAAAVAVVAVVAGNLTDIHSNPPISNPPSPTITAPAIAPIGATIVLVPTLKGRTLTMKVTVSGTVLAPKDPETGTDAPKDTSFVNLSLGTEEGYGDGSQRGGSDGGGMTCAGAKTRRTGTETYQLLDPHTYQKAGTFTFLYRIRYCGSNGAVFKVEKSMPIVVG
ncbi:hypothetical protein GCM10009554_76600 [Kribbella koreensis]|uniref:Tat pathway signal sequence domain protein n=2 Tax=Kribbella TaxID=182639 RepID=A0ABP6WD10_9ACTN